MDRCCEIRTSAIFPFVFATTGTCLGSRGVHSGTRLDVYIVVKDSDPSRHIHFSTILPATETLRKIDVPGGLSLFLRTGTNNYWRTIDGLRYFCQIAKVHQQQEDIGDIDQRLWMASKGPSRSKCV
ncbi:hypothetical protein ARMGADRAFT_1007429 [Armillaria gallica]|uniref:Uncharacterized protein n=1 Tax=Armillaria gallica TaxID=47427 RepID=A0A2H3E1R6_ARMGA|nr:hypothetical protein ARMGADRAFT_1007429 [Armillaria gallica]